MNKHSFGKKGFCLVRNGYTACIDELKEEHRILPCCHEHDYQPSKRNGKVTEKNSGAKFITDDTVLRFKAHFNYKLINCSVKRNVFINYFLVNNTIEVVEKPEENSGFIQGKLLKRQKIPKKNGNAFNWRDFNIGKDLNFYGRVYHIHSAFPITRKWYESEGIDLEEDEKDQNEIGKTPVENMKSSQCLNTKFKLRKFLIYGNKTLHFSLAAKEPQADGDLIDWSYYFLVYFLSDDTLAVYEEIPGIKNSKKKFLQRQKVPRVSNREVLYFPSTPTECSNSNDFYITFRDLKVGSTIELYNKLFHIYDCTGETKQFIMDANQ